jgi:hypothetical protein
MPPWTPESSVSSAEVAPLIYYAFPESVRMLGLAVPAMRSHSLGGSWHEAAAQLPLHQRAAAQPVQQQPVASTEHHGGITNAEQPLQHAVTTEAAVSASQLSQPSSDMAPPLPVQQHVEQQQQQHVEQQQQQHVEQWMSGHESVTTLAEAADTAPLQAPAALPGSAPAQQAASTSTPPLQPSAPQRVLRERRVPSTQIGRALGFAGMGASLLLGSLTDSISRTLGGSSGGSSSSSDGASSSSGAAGALYSGIITESNAERLANALCRMRGAALKIGQMLSIQDENVLPPQVCVCVSVCVGGGGTVQQHCISHSVISHATMRSDCCSFSCCCCCCNLSCSCCWCPRAVWRRSKQPLSV